MAELTKLTKDLNIVQKLDDEPNDVGGLTAAQLKAKFDEGANAIKDYINNILIPDILKAGFEPASQIVTLTANGWQGNDGLQEQSVSVPGMTASKAVVSVGLHRGDASNSVYNAMHLSYAGNISRIDQEDGALKFVFLRKPSVDLTIAVGIA